MSIHVVVTAVIYHALNGNTGPGSAAKGRWLKFYLNVKGAGAWPNSGPSEGAEASLRGPICLEQKDWYQGRGAMGQDVSGFGDPSRHPGPVGRGLTHTGTWKNLLQALG